MNRLTRKGSFAVLLLSAFVLQACAAAPLTGRRQLILVPEAELLSMSFQSYDQLIGESTLSRDASRVSMVRRVGERVAAAAERFLLENGLERELAKFDWQFNLIEDDETVNAFCMPGGKVAVYTGILPLTGSEAGLAVIVGHEVAHAVARHGNERMSQGLLVELGGATLAAAMKEKPQQTQQLFMTLYGVGAQVGLMLPYSRAHESEADRIGLTFMAMAGYDPREAIPFWQRMGGLGGGKRPPELLSTHPAPTSRIEDIRTYLPEAMRYYQP